jgi:FkbM family methyltransferase
MIFYSELIKELLVASKNDFPLHENHDHVRFGKIEEQRITNKGRLRKKLEKVFESRGYVITQKDKGFENVISEKLKMFDPYLSNLERFYNLLSDDDSKKLLIQVVAFRLLGLTKVKLPLSNPGYWKGVNKIEEIANENDYLESKFMNWHLPLVDLNKWNIPIQLYFPPIGIYSDFFVKQYEFNNGNKIIKAKKGDYVIDAGGCWGDTALYFANEVGEDGKVFAFEFIPSNLDIFYKNLALNPAMEKRVSVVKRPVWEISEETMYYIDNGPGSRVSKEKEGSYNGIVTSLSIDDLVSENYIPRIDFIKMDIEGAEPYALKGAIETIKKFKPKLAIAIYHSLSDFVNIPIFLHELDLGYELHFAHCSIHEEESILFAEIPTK